MGVSIHTRHMKKWPIINVVAYQLYTHWDRLIEQNVMSVIVMVVVMCLTFNAS